MSAFGVHSEVGKLRKVIVHRPDLSLQRLTPTTHDELLFDDVLWVEQAQREHDAFVALMRGRGTEVYYVHDLLAETLADSDEARTKLIEAVASPYTVGWSACDEVRAYLSGLDPQTLAKHLIGGMTAAEAMKAEEELRERNRAENRDHYVSGITTTGNLYHQLGQYLVRVNHLGHWHGYFRTLARGTELPIMIYNNRPAYKLDLMPESFAALAGEKNIVAVKESSHDSRRITDMINLLGDRYQIVCGVDDLMLENVLFGAVGRFGRR